MLNFRPVTLDDKETIEKFTSLKNHFMCSHCFVDIFIWQLEYSTEMCVYDDFLLLKATDCDDGTIMYIAPIGQGDYKSAVEAIIKDSEERGIPFIMTSIPEEIKPEIEMLFPDKFVFTEEIDHEDYIYLAESMITLKGKKLHSKRNFINRFMKEHDGRWQYEEIDSSNIQEIFDFHLDWCGLKECVNEDEFLGETCAISRILKNMDKLEVKGGLIRLDGKIIAFTLGSKSHDDMFIVHIEKANSEIAGAYQMINQQFAMRNFTDVTYVNREEDLGIEGLRKAKQSYYPYKMGVNFTAIFKE